MLLTLAALAFVIGCGKEESNVTIAEAPSEGPPEGMMGEMGGMMGGGFNPTAIFDRRDENGDGKLTGEELSGRMADRVEQLDTDKNGEISREEFEAGMPNMFAGGGPGGGGRPGGFGRGGGRGNRPERPTRPELDDESEEEPAATEGDTSSEETKAAPKEADAPDDGAAKTSDETSEESSE